ncbi:MAG: DUF1156 domain-containing protein [Deltaproteobacteria bacterium]|nr:DUF1156 domain-containing protein [Deltaproteobacteria bacterium]
MADTRLIERWLPIAEIGIESIRERTPMTPFPAPNRLHVWWARRPLVASRAAVLASLLPEDADREKFLQVIGIHGDPVASRRRIDAARRTGQRFEGQAYGYPRAFSHVPGHECRCWLMDVVGQQPSELSVLDPTAGGGSIPFETSRVGFEAFANDLNPVATLVMRATVQWPSEHGRYLSRQFELLAARFIKLREELLSSWFPVEAQEDCISTNFLWARTITCPYCEGRVPLSPNWRLASDGTGVRLTPHLGDGPGSKGRICTFDVVHAVAEQSAGTVARGDGTCPFPDCGRVIDGDVIKAQAQAGRMGEQLYAVVYKERVEYETKTGQIRVKWVRGYRAPCLEDDNGAEVLARLDEKLPEWEALDVVPSERFPKVSNDDRPIQYGMPLWRDLFSPRQLLCHGTSVEIFRDMFDADRAAGQLDEIHKAAYGYLALALDKLRDYNSRMTRWHANRQVMVNTFDRHDFAFKWSYAEMAPLITGLGYDWAIKQTAKCIAELVALVHPDSRVDAAGPDLFDRVDEEADQPSPPPSVTITCKPGDSLDHILDESIDAVVMDPPYYDNVMYAELSDFFYVWLKRTAGDVFPELFRRQLTDKENEAVANPAKFQGEKGARAHAGDDYQERMAAIFAECRRVLKPDGIMTLMFTHKATGAWDALTKGLIEAGFAITASWPINTEAEGSLHIKDKAAANSTIFLVCRPRVRDPFLARDEPDLYWEDVEPRVASAVRSRVREFQEAGIAGVDLYLASFGPALEEFSRHWPIKRGTPRELPAERRRRRQHVMFEEEWDPYAATPEDALGVARREVKRWRLEQLTHLKANADLDAATAFFVLAWDAFKAPVFSYDEALRLARAVGVDLDSDVVGRLAEKKGSDIRLWDSATRAAKGTLGPADGSRGMIDAIHHAANLARLRSLDAARDLLATTLVDKDPRFFASLEAVLEVLPVSRVFTGIELAGEAAASGTDFETLYNLSRFAYSDRIDEPEQLKLWQDGNS